MERSTGGGAEDRPGAVPPPTPNRIGRYRIGPVLGVGGMGTVYRAEVHGEAGFRRACAVKVLHPHLAHAPSGDDGSGLPVTEAVFLREGRLAARCHHLNVVPVLDAGRTPSGQVFLVLDLVPGVSLGVLRDHGEAAGGPGPLGRALGMRILLDGLAGLHAAHEVRGDDGAPAGLVHRDFTPGNLLVDVYGHTRLGDFGLAKEAAGAKLTRTDAVKGTTAYLSPEQARGEPLARQSDLWAAGVVAWELLSGGRLFAEDRVDSVLRRILFETPPPLSSVWPEAPEELEAVVAWALHRSPAGRPRTALELGAALEAAFIAGVGPLASRAEVGRRVEEAAGPAPPWTRSVLEEEAVRVDSPASGPRPTTARTDRPKAPGARRGPAVLPPAASPVFATGQDRSRTPRARRASWAAAAAALLLLGGVGGAAAVSVFSAGPGPATTGDEAVDEEPSPEAGGAGLPGDPGPRPGAAPSPRPPPGPRAQPRDPSVKAVRRGGGDNPEREPGDGPPDDTDPARPGPADARGTGASASPPPRAARGERDGRSATPRRTQGRRDRSRLGSQAASPGEGDAPSLADNPYAR